MRRDEQGFSIAEMAVAMMVGAAALAMATTVIVAGMRTSLFTQHQSDSLDEARTAMQQIEKELRGAVDLNWCAPAGNCLQIATQTPGSAARTVKYTLTGADLNREVWDSQTSTWKGARVVLSKLTNTASEPVFSCASGSSLVRVDVDLRVKPTSRSDSPLNVTTSLTPRNMSSVC